MTCRSNKEGTRGSSILAASDKHATDKSCNGHPPVCYVTYIKDFHVNHIYNWS